MIPERTKQTIDDYVSKGADPGDFVGAVLSNDLKMSFAAADEVNRRFLFDIVCYVYNEIPWTCHGSREIVNKWMLEVREGLKNDISR